MKHPLLTLLALTVMLVPWLSLVALGDWIKARRERFRGIAAES